MDIRHISSITNDELHSFTPFIILDITNNVYTISYTTIQTTTFSSEFSQTDSNKSIHQKYNLLLLLASDIFTDLITEDTLFFRR